MNKLAEGPNYELSQESTVLHLRVFKRPDQSLSEGAENAGNMMDEVARRLESHSGLTGVVLNLLDAPVAGPKTRQTLGDALDKWVGAGKRVAVLVEHPAMKMMFTRLLETGAPEQGAMFTRVREGVLWCVGMSMESIRESSTRLSKVDPDDSGVLG